MKLNRTLQIILGVLGAITSSAIVSSLIARRRQIMRVAPTGEVAEPVTSGAAASEMLAVDLDVEGGLPGVMPRLKAMIRLVSADRASLRHVCMSWNGGQDECCAHVMDVTTQSYVLSPANREVTYLFDRCSPARVEEATSAKDLRLLVYSADTEAPVHAVRRKALLRHLERWLSALDSYYSEHSYDRTSAEPERRIRRAA